MDYPTERWGISYYGLWDSVGLRNRNCRRRSANCKCRCRRTDSNGIDSSYCESVCCACIQSCSSERRCSLGCYLFYPCSYPLVPLDFVARNSWSPIVHWGIPCESYLGKSSTHNGFRQSCGRIRNSNANLTRRTQALCVFGIYQKLVTRSRIQFWGS